MKILRTIVLFCIVLLSGESAKAQFEDKWALFVVADAINANAAETVITERLQEMGFEVIAISQNDVSDEQTEDASLVLISATISSGTIETNMPGLIDLEIPVINWEPAIYDTLGFQEVNGSEFNTTDIEIVLPDHFLAAGLSGTTTITTIQKAISYGTPQGDVDIIAVNANDTSQAVLFGYETGAAMYKGNAPARRVGTFLLNDAADAMTDEGWALFDASVMWAMGAEEPISVEKVVKNIPEQFILYNNYPNPFNPATQIAFSLPAQARVRVDIFNVLGQKVVALIDEVRPAGNHAVTFNASEMSTGIYYYRLEAGSFSAAGKMLFLK